MPHTPAAYLTAALRGRLVRAAINEANATDIACFLAELDLNPTLENTPENLCRYLLSQLALWAREPESTEKLVRCCEGLAQFYLWEAGKNPELLKQINTHLPQGLSFSLISGRLLLDNRAFYAPENPFLAESPVLERVHPQQVSEQPVTVPHSSEAPLETPVEAPHDRQTERQRIVSQRMNMLKNQLSGRTGS